MGVCCWHGRCDTHRPGTRGVEPRATPSGCRPSHRVTQVAAGALRLCLGHRLSSSQWSRSISLGPLPSSLVLSFPPWHLRVVETMRCGSGDPPDPHPCLIRHSVTVTSGAFGRALLLLFGFSLLWVSVRVGRDPALKTPAQISSGAALLFPSPRSLSCRVAVARTRRCGTRGAWHSDG